MSRLDTLENIDLRSLGDSLGDSRSSYGSREGVGMIALTPNRWDVDREVKLRIEHVVDIETASERNKMEEADEDVKSDSDGPDRIMDEREAVSPPGYIPDCAEGLVLGERLPQESGRQAVRNSKARARANMEAVHNHLNEEERISSASAIWEHEKECMSLELRRNTIESAKLKEEVRSLRATNGTQKKEIEYQRDALDLYRGRTRDLDRDKILHSRKAVELERFDEIFKTMVKEYNFNDAQDAFRYLQKMNVAQAQLMEDLALSQAQCLEGREKLRGMESIASEKLRLLQKKVDDMAIDHRKILDKRDEEIDGLRAEQRREKTAAGRYESLKNAVIGIWSRWRCSSHGEDEEMVTGSLVALTDPMEILPALERCFTVHSDADASARHIRKINGAINSLWRRNFSDNTDIKSQSVAVVDHASSAYESLKAKVSDLRSQTHSAEKDRKEAIEHLRASERARRTMHIALEHLKGQLKIHPKLRRVDHGLVIAAEEDTQDCPMGHSQGA